jgi:hypothetical protein
MVNRRAREITEVGMEINAFEFLLSFFFFIFVFRLSKRKFYRTVLRVSYSLVCYFSGNIIIHDESENINLMC